MGEKFVSNGHVITELPDDRSPRPDAKLPLVPWKQIKQGDTTLRVSIAQNYPDAIHVSPPIIKVTDILPAGLTPVSENPGILASMGKPGLADTFPTPQGEMGRLTSASIVSSETSGGEVGRPPVSGETLRTQEKTVKAQVNGVDFRTEENGDRIISLSDGTPEGITLSNLPPEVEGVLQSYVQLSAANPDQDFTGEEFEQAQFFPQRFPSRPNRPGETHFFIVNANATLEDSLLMFRYTTDHTVSEPYVGNTYYLKKLTPEEAVYQKKRREARTQAHERQQGRVVQPDLPAITAEDATFQAHRRPASIAPIRYETRAPMQREAVPAPLPLGPAIPVFDAATHVVAQRAEITQPHQVQPAREAADVVTLTPGGGDAATASPAQVVEREAPEMLVTTTTGEPPLLKQFPIERKERPEVTDQHLRNTVYVSVARELGQHAKKPKLEVIMKLVNEKMKASLPKDQQASYTPVEIDPEALLETFFAELDSRKKEGEANDRYARRKDTESIHWTHEGDEQSWKYLRDFRQKSGMGPRSFDSFVRESLLQQLS